MDSVDVATPIGLRDRALVAPMVYSFARIGAALAMKVEDVFVAQRRRWTRVRERRQSVDTAARAESGRFACSRRIMRTASSRIALVAELS